jgi:hypothetical protein
MIVNKSICGIIILSLLLVMTGAWSVFAQPQSSLGGTWAVQYADGSAGTMTVEKNTLTLKIPEIGEIKGIVQERGDYFESILSDRRDGVNFLFGYLKGGRVEGKLQEKMPCAELKKAFKSGVAAGANSCQLPFAAVKK